MFSKILIANRGEIAVRIVRACREMGIGSVAVYEEGDQDSLHVRLADECRQLGGEASFFDEAALLAIARESGCDAVHPGYGYLAERASFAAACAAAGLTFIGPSPEVIERSSQKIPALQAVAAAGFPTVVHSARSFTPDEQEQLVAAAAEIGYPLVLKSCVGGRGPGERLAAGPEQLQRALGQAWAESRAFYGGAQLYLEKAILPTQQIGVQIAADRHGRLIHLGEREGSLVFRGRKAIEESPAPDLDDGQRAAVCAAAIEIARLFGVDNVATVEFFVDAAGKFYFSEIKARLQVEHPLTEMRASVDLVRLQLEAAAGLELSLTQEEVRLAGWAILARLRAEDPLRNFLPSPGQIQRIRFPGGSGIRVDSYVYCRMAIPGRYDPLFAKICAWGESRSAAVGRLRGALEDTKVIGMTTNVAALRQVLDSEPFLNGRYHTEHALPPFDEDRVPPTYLSDLAAVAAVLYSYRTARFQPSEPERFRSGWHRGSRRLPS